LSINKVFRKVCAFWLVLGLGPTLSQGTGTQGYRDTGLQGYKNSRGYPWGC